MTEVERIEDRLLRTFEGDPWHGWPMMRIVGGITHEAAARRPVAGAHTIWEIVLHVIAWEGAVIARIEHGQIGLPAEGDWPAVTDTREAAWAAALKRMREIRARLLETVRHLPVERLGERLGAERDIETGGGVTILATLDGIVDHNLYHAGQIALLAKA